MQPECAGLQPECARGLQPRRGTYRAEHGGRDGAIGEGVGSGVREHEVGRGGGGGGAEHESAWPEQPQ